MIYPKLKKPDLDPEDYPHSYRNITNLPMLAKIIEGTIRDQLCPFIDENKLLPKYQSAYRRFHSTETALTKVYSDILMHLDKSRSVFMIFLDLSSAFDTLNHDILVDELFAFGIRDRALGVLKTYLTGRSSRDYVEGATSEARPMCCGVPQGSILGPILFNLYTRSLAALFDSLGVSYHIYADDIEIYFPFDLAMWPGCNKESKTSSVLSKIGCSLSSRCSISKRQR